MPLYFDARNPSFETRYRLRSFFLFAYAKQLSRVFFAIFLFLFIGFLAGLTGLDALATFFGLFLLFWQFHIFNYFAIERYRPQEKKSSVADNLNIPDRPANTSASLFFIIKDAIDAAERMKLSRITLPTILYTLLSKSEDVQRLFFALEVNINEVKMELKNRMEKQKQGGRDQGGFLDPINSVFNEASEISREMGYDTIRELDMIVALAKHDLLFRQILGRNGLKGGDVAVAAKWFGIIEAENKFWNKKRLSDIIERHKRWVSGFFKTQEHFLINNSNGKASDLGKEISESDFLYFATHYLKKHYRVAVTYPALKEAKNLTLRYFPDELFYKKAIDILGEAAALTKSLGESAVHSKHVIQVVSGTMKVPLGKMKFGKPLRSLDIVDIIHRRIVDQTEAIDDIVSVMGAMNKRAASSQKPLATMLFLGPGGVGKTETAKAIADFYVAKEENMVTVSLKDFQGIRGANLFIGMRGEPGILAKHIKNHPSSLVMIKDIENANRSVLNALSNVFKKGYLIDGRGKKITARNNIFVCASRAGSEIMLPNTTQSSQLSKEDFLEHLFREKIFKKKFVDQFDAVAIFRPLGKEQIVLLVRLMFEKMKKNLSRKGINILSSDSFEKNIVEKYYAPEAGAHAVKKAFMDKIENVIMEKISSGKIIKGDRVEIVADNFEVYVLPRG